MTLKIGEVELATISFGQSFQLTTLRLLTTISSFVNGGHTVVPHFGMAISSFDGTSTQKLLIRRVHRYLMKQSAHRCVNV